MSIKKRLMGAVLILLGCVAEAFAIAANPLLPPPQTHTFSYFVAGIVLIATGAMIGFKDVIYAGLPDEDDPEEEVSTTGH